MMSSGIGSEVKISCNWDEDVWCTVKGVRA